MKRIEKKFKTLRKQNKKAFIAFITAGYPNLKTTVELVKEFEQSGVDIVELGVPFTDPMADGPVIQEASQVALKNKTRLVDILELVKKVRQDVQLPICLMSYYNPVFCLGEATFVSKAKECGVDGVIISDLPPEEGTSLIQRARQAGIEVISFLSPTSTAQRIKQIASLAGGFIYYVSLTGVTGRRRGLAQGLKENIRAIKRQTKTPVCVGFGVSTPAQVRQIQAFADGVIVGSAIVEKIKENIGNPDLVKKVSNYVLRLAGCR
jgi:tryptophan synthase alpha chain